MDITKHALVPKQSKVSDSEKAKVIEKYHVDLKALPTIYKDDPAIAKLSVKVGDMIKIERESKSAGVSVYYRVVIDG